MEKHLNLWNTRPETSNYPARRSWGIFFITSNGTGAEVLFHNHVNSVSFLFQNNNLKKAIPTIMKNI